MGFLPQRNRFKVLPRVRKTDLVQIAIAAASLADLVFF